MDISVTFGEWVRQRRKALDLTQAALARRAGCAAVTIQKIEAGERRPSRQVAELLAAALEVPLEERPAFVRRARGETPVRQAPAAEGALAEAPAAGRPAHNLPAEPNSFVGRARALAEVAGLLERARLVTLTGPGGTGKTRLALQAARQALPGFADGVWLVSLASLRAPEQVAPAVAEALGVQTGDRAGPVPALKRQLRPKRLLLVLDNFEHLLGAAPLAGELLVAAPELKILATSREALGIYGEQAYPVPPLAVPAAHRPELWPALGQVEAVALFVARAQAAQPDFALEAGNAEAVAEICLRLEGLPLALELAAARAKLFGPAELLGRLETRLPTLTGGPRDAPHRQQTLRNTIAWSYNLLTEAEQALFAGLAAFAGGFDLEAAEAVLGPVAARGGVTVVDGLASLVNKSLVQRQSGRAGRSRFRMLETIREFAGERWEPNPPTPFLAREGGGAGVTPQIVRPATSEVTAEPKADRLRERHLDYFVQLAETAADQILGAAQTEWLDRLADERANLEAALAWGLESPEAGAAEAGLRLAGALGWYWHFRGHWAEGRRWLAQVLARPEGDPEARARALCAAGLLAWAQDEYAEAEEKLRAGLDLLPAEPPTLARAHAAGILGLVLLYEENLAAAEPLFDRALQTFRALGDAFGVGISLIRLGIVARLQGNFTRAERVSTESLETYRALNNVWGIATASANLGEIALDQEDWQTATGHYRRALAAMGPTGSQWYLALSLLGVAGVAVTRGAAGEAARLLGVVEAMVKSVEGRIPTMDRRMFERYRARAWAALGAAEFEAARAEGQAAAPAIWQGWVEAALRA